MKRFAILALFFAATLPMFATSVPQQLSSKELAALVGSAKTAAEHQRIAAYYRGESERLLAESNDHARMALSFRVNPATNNDKHARGTVNHCDFLAQSLKAKAEKAVELAELHERMAAAVVK